MPGALGPEVRGAEEEDVGDFPDHPDSVEGALRPPSTPSVVLAPMSMQGTARAEAGKSGREWAAASPLPLLRWPEALCKSPGLPARTEATLRDAAHTVRAEVGLG